MSLSRLKIFEVESIGDSHTYLHDMSKKAERVFLQHTYDFRSQFQLENILSTSDPDVISLSNSVDNLSGIVISRRLVVLLCLLSTGELFLQAKAKG